MMPSNILNKVVLSIFFIILIIITGCDVSNNNLSTNKDNINHSGSDGDVATFENSRVSVISKADTLPIEPNTKYTISFENNSYRSTLNNSDEISFDIIRFSDMANFSVAEIVNESVENAMTAWVSGKVVNASSVDLDILFHSDKYLSFVNVFEYSAKRIDYVKDYITIDIKSGKRMMLNDLVEINKEFIEYIRKSDIARDSERNILSDGRDEKIWEYLKSIEPDDLLKKLEQCSLTQEQVIQDGYFPIESSIEALVFRNSFYLKNNSIIIVLQHGGGVTHNTTP